MHPLDGARLKFIRACTQLKALNGAVLEFNKTDTCMLVPELNKQTKECVIRVKILQSPPLELAIAIGEIAHNLRSCLDHIVWQLALSQVATPFGKTEFPIFTADKLFSKNGLKSIQDLSPTQKAFIESLQPYHAGQSAQEHPLWMLHELNNADKHRTLTVTNVAIFYGPDPPGEFGLYFSGGDKRQAIEISITMGAQLGIPLEDNAVFAAFQVLDMGLQKQVTVRAVTTSNMVFGKGIGASSGRKVDESLQSIFEQVDTIISACPRQFF
jgi:hypothetical protein